jgi:hypothetical protein
MPSGLNSSARWQFGHTTACAARSKTDSKPQSGVHRDPGQPVRPVDEEPAGRDVIGLARDRLQAWLEVASLPLVDLAVGLPRHRCPGQERTLGGEVLGDQGPHVRAREPQAAVTEVRTAGVVRGDGVLDVPGPQAHDLGAVALAPEDGLDEPAREVPVRHLDAMRIQDLHARAQALLEGIEAHLDEELRRRIAFSVGMARNDLRPLGLDTVADDGLADVLGPAGHVVGHVDLVARGRAQDQERRAVATRHADRGVVGFEGRAAFRAREDDGQRARRGWFDQR